MERTAKWVSGTAAFGLAVYLLSPGLFTLIDNPAPLTWRNELVNLTGVIALALMALTMVISVRPGWADRITGGLDKAYVIHKWAGIFSMVALLLHWLMENFPKWMVEWGWITHPGHLGGDFAPPFWMIAVVRTGVLLVEPAFYLLVILVAVALIPKVPYHLFRMFHKVFPIVFLIGAYHSVTILFKLQWWLSPAAWLILALALTGVWASFIALKGRIGTSRKYAATIDHIDRYENGLVDLVLDVQGNGFASLPGQYAFLTFAHSSEPHPYTIASSGDDPRHVRFVIKALGDHTSALPDKIESGQPVTIEGPYGQFFLDRSGERQIWVAGGIGITPFMARLEALAHDGGSRKPVDFWYCTTSEADARFPDRLEELCHKAGVTLHRMSAASNQFLNADIIRDTIRNLQDTTVWFCGPEGFARSLKAGLASYGVKPSAFHHDNFNMR